MKTTAERIGARLRQLRIARGFTQRELARRLRSHREIVCRPERGVCMPSQRTLALYAAMLGCRLLDVTVVLDTHPDWDIERGRWRGAA